MIEKSLIWTVVYDAFAEHGRCELAIDILGVQIGVFAIQYEVIPFWAKKDGGRFPEEDECEAIAVLGSTIKEELVWVYAILDCAADPRKYVEHDGRAVRVGKTDLSQHILSNSNEDDENDSHGNGVGKRYIE